MKEITGRIIAAKIYSPLNRKKQSLEIELDKRDIHLINWQNKKVVIKKVD